MFFDGSCLYDDRILVPKEIKRCRLAYTNGIKCLCFTEEEESLSEHRSVRSQLLTCFDNADFDLVCEQ